MLPVTVPFRPIAAAVAACLAMSGVPFAASAQLSMPPAQWDEAAARELLGYAQTIGSEGLDPADYRLDTLSTAINKGAPDAIDAAATRTFALLAHDLAAGHAPTGARKDNHLPTSTLTPSAAERMMELALATHTVTASLAGLLPTSSDYRALRAALAETPESEPARRLAIRVNMERWRWLPHDLGKRYLVVNVPAFELRVMDNGELVATHRVIVGKSKTQTPEFMARVTGVLLNPDWTVPQSIIAESVGKLVRTRPATARARGYTWTTDASGRLHVVQKPGDNNALGRYKLVMPNPWTIYVHDTPSKQLFEKDARAYSHGCIRLDQPAALVTRLLDGTQWTPERIAETIASGEMVTASLARPLPILVTYFTAAPDTAGNIILYKDIYGRDDAIARALGPGSAPALGAAMAQAARDERCDLG